MTKKTTVQIQAIPEGFHKKAGEFDKGGRWHPHNKWRVLPDHGGIFDAFAEIRGPSRAWPYSYLKHFYTKKYARKIVRFAPLLYLETQRIDKDSDTGKLVLANAVAQKILD